MSRRLCSELETWLSSIKRACRSLSPRQTSESSESRRRKCSESDQFSTFSPPCELKNELLKGHFAFPRLWMRSLLEDDHEKARRAWLRCRSFHTPDRAKRPAVCASAGWLSDTTVQRP